jgi:hypothetical protein
LGRTGGQTVPRNVEHVERCDASTHALIKLRGDEREIRRRCLGRVPTLHGDSLTAVTIAVMNSCLAMKDRRVVGDRLVQRDVR